MDPAVVLKSDAFTCLLGINIEERLLVAYQQLMQKIEFFRNTSGWGCTSLRTGRPWNPLIWST